MFELYLHDYSTLSVQLLEVSPIESDLEKIADKMNYLFGNSGYADKFEAQVCKADNDDPIKERKAYPL